eukprot:364451-Chlamydomonas_euryale.AAC.2
MVLFRSELFERGLNSCRFMNRLIKAVVQPPQRAPGVSVGFEQLRLPVPNGTCSVAGALSWGMWTCESGWAWSGSGLSSGLRRCIHLSDMQLCKRCQGPQALIVSVWPCCTRPLHVDQRRGGGRQTLAASHARSAARRTSSRDTSESGPRVRRRNALMPSQASGQCVHACHRKPTR